MEGEMKECPELLANRAKVLTVDGIKVEHVEQVLGHLSAHIF